MFKDYQNIWFLGIGGIGMSALARYMMLQSKHVSGYDRARSVLTSKLTKEGVSIAFDDDVESIAEAFRNPATTLVVTTPAINSENRMLTYFQNHNFKIVKRAQLLGVVSKDYKTIALAGTHGKTTVSTMAAHLLKALGHRVHCIAGRHCQRLRHQLFLFSTISFSRYRS